MWFNKSSLQNKHKNEFSTILGCKMNLIFLNVETTDLAALEQSMSRFNRTARNFLNAISTRINLSL